MPHYFNEDNDTLKSNQKMIAFSVNGTPLKFYTDYGVFSKDGFDRGTEVLLKYLKVNPNHKTALDLGCGYGVVGVYLNKEYQLEVDMVDMNNRAIELSIKNLELNNVKGTVYKSDGLNDITKSYDLIITNPPIRAGKETVHRFFTDSYNHLTDNGELFVVINKKHGAESAFKKLSELYREVTLLGRKKGFHVYKCQK